MAKKEDFIRCTTHTEDDGVVVFSDEKKGTAIALKLPHGGVVDLRDNPPFLQMVPCPYCGSDNPNKHVGYLHVDHTMGCASPAVKAAVRENIRRARRGKYMSVGSPSLVDYRWGEINVILPYKREGT